MAGKLKKNFMRWSFNWKIQILFIKMLIICRKMLKFNKAKLKMITRVFFKQSQKVNGPRF